MVASLANAALITSGGGFSNVATQPAWQSAAVSAFLSSGAMTPGSGNFNPTMRGYPDVSALGHNVSELSCGGVGVCGRDVGVSAVTGGSVD